jgi:hypothetical protein
LVRSILASLDRDRSKELEAAVAAEIARRLGEAEAGGGQNPSERGAVWTYLTTDQPFGGWTARVLAGLRRKSPHQ